MSLDRVPGQRFSALVVYGGLRVLPLTMSTQGCPIPDDHSGG